MMKFNLLSGLYALALFLGLTTVSVQAELRVLPSPPYLIVDAASGKVFARNKAFTRWAPASLTKLMTAYTVFKALELQHLAMNSPVRITEEAIAEPPSKMGLPIGTILTIENALKIIMVKSANDVSVALAQAVGGSEEQFVRLMNVHAKRLGMTDSSFTNPHGLHDPEQFTTARDMALLAMAIGREFPQHAGFFDIPALRVVGRRLRNHNALLRLFDGTNGMKTGYVCASGYNVVVRTKRQERELIAVVLGHKSGLSRSVAAAELLTDAFSAEKGGFRPTINSILKPADVTDTPVDITRQICPGKYPERTVPAVRPEDAPKTQDFDGIDTQVLAEREERERDPYKNLPVPEKRPFYKFVAKEAETQAPKVAVENTSEKVEKPHSEKPDLKTLAKKYLVPRSDLRPDEKIALGGGVGPNPFAVKHTDGGPYKAPVPLPTRRPEQGSSDKD